MIGALISSAAGLIGGMLNRSSTEKANEINQQNALRQEALQREFAQSGIQWKVADAKKAGIHPLAALGANTVSYSPSTVGTAADTSFGSAVASSGQDISRAIEATRTRGARDSAFNKSVQDLTIQKMGLENQLLASQIAKQRAQLGPAMPALTDANGIPGQPATRQVTLPGIGIVTTPKKESQQQDISNEYGDEGLPQIPGQIRFVRDTAKAWGRNAYKGYKESYLGKADTAIYNRIIRALRPYNYSSGW